MRPICVAALCLSLLAPALAAALEPAQAGKINADLAEKEAAIRKEYGGKSDKELTGSERREMQKKVQGAREEVLKKNNVSDKDYERGMLKLGREGLAESQKVQKDIETQRAADAKKAADAKGAKAETKVEVQKGFGKDGADSKMVEIPVPAAPTAGGNPGK